MIYHLKRNSANLGRKLSPANLDDSARVSRSRLRFRDPIYCSRHLRLDGRLHPKLRLAKHVKSSRQREVLVDNTLFFVYPPYTIATANLYSDGYKSLSSEMCFHLKILSRNQQLPDKGYLTI